MAERALDEEGGAQVKDKGLKVAISGKGGVGKTTLAALLAEALGQMGWQVLAVDADPDANLAQALGIDASGLVPVSQMNELIAERTGAPAGSVGSFFNLNPRVDDLPEKLTVAKGPIRLMVLGTIPKGGAGCICPASALLKALLMHMVFGRKEAVVVDMEAGLEHLGRATSRGMDSLIVVVEPGRRSIETAHQIRRLAADLGIKNVVAVGNKLRGEHDEQFLARELAPIPLLATMNYDPALVEADIHSTPLAEASASGLKTAKALAEKLIEMSGS